MFDPALVRGLRRVEYDKLGELGSFDHSTELSSRRARECGIPDYWIVNLVDDLVEVHSDIVNDRYARITPYRRGDVVRSIVFGDVAIAVDDVLPKPR